MPRDNDATTGKELVDRLLAFAQNPAEDVISMSTAEIDAYLQEEGIDAGAGCRELKRKLKAINGQRRLADARRGMEQFAGQVSRLAAKPKDALTNVREEILHRLGTISGSEPAVAQVYFRKLEGATDDDLESILEDLKLLDELEKGDR